MAQLQIIAGQNAGQSVSIQSNGLYIGRSRQCGLVIDDPTVSRTHAFIAQHGGNFYIQNVGSGSVYINNRQITQSDWLSANDVIQIGQTQMRFTTSGHANAIGNAMQNVKKQVGSINMMQSAAQPVRQEPQNYYSDMQRAMAGSKSYVTPAVITLIAYYIGFGIIGLIINIMYLWDAHQQQKIAGHGLAGVGCLWALLIHAILPLILMISFLNGLFAFGAALNTF